MEMKQKHKKVVELKTNEGNKLSRAICGAAIKIFTEM